MEFLPLVVCRVNTVNVASEEYILPKEFLATHLYLALVACISTKRKAKDEFPPTEEKLSINSLSFNQPITGTGKPAARQDIVTFSPSLTETSSGCMTKYGLLITSVTKKS